jgi:hypothetical protein
MYCVPSLVSNIACAIIEIAAVESVAFRLGEISSRFRFFVSFFIAYCRFP